MYTYERDRRGFYFCKANKKNVEKKLPLVFSSFFSGGEEKITRRYLHKEQEKVFFMLFSFAKKRSKLKLVLLGNMFPWW